MLDIAQTYGLKIRNNKALCPFHDDNRPSFSINTKTNRWRCFVCNEGGDAVDFVAKLYGLSPLDALKKIGSDLSLGSPVRPANPTQTESQKLSKKLKEWYEWAGQIVLAAHCDAHWLILDLQPRSQDEEPAQEWLAALSALPRLEYLVTFWIESPPQTQEDYLDLYVNFKREINNYAKHAAIRRNTA
jgi:hypothetical protein